MRSLRELKLHLSDRIKGYRHIPPQHVYGNIYLEAEQSAYLIMPKCACSSINSALARHLGIRLFNPILNWHFPRLDRRIHMLKFPTLDLKKIPVGKAPYLFTFVRHPVKRVISCFHDKILADPNYTSATYVKGVSSFLKEAYGDTFYSGMPFAEFLDAVCSIPDNEADVHFRSMSSILEFHLHQHELDRFGKVESLEEDWRAISHHLGIHQTLGRLHVSQKHNSIQPTRSQLSQIHKRYQTDFKRFGYDPEVY